MSPDVAIVYERSQGRDYLFADRFEIEFVSHIKQTVDPRITTETDPQRILSMFSTHIEVRGRMNILKSLALLKGRITAET